MYHTHKTPHDSWICLSYSVCGAHCHNSFNLVVANLHEAKRINCSSCPQGKTLHCIKGTVSRYFVIFRLSNAEMNFPILTCSKSFFLVIWIQCCRAVFRYLFVFTENCVVNKCVKINIFEAEKIGFFERFFVKACFQVSFIL